MEPRVVLQLALAWLLFFLSAGATYTAPPVLLKPIMDEFGLNQAQVSLFPAVFLLSKGICALPSGEILHRYGAHCCLLWGTVVLTACTAVYACFACRLWQFLALHAAFGVCYSLGGLAANLCLCNAICSARTKASAIGLVVTAFSMAGVAWPPLCALLAEAYGWRVAYAACPAALVTLGLPAAFALSRLGRRAVAAGATAAAGTSAADGIDCHALAVPGAEGGARAASSDAACWGDLALEPTAPAASAEAPAAAPADARAELSDSGGALHGAVYDVGEGTGTAHEKRSRGVGGALRAVLAAWLGAWWLREPGVWHLLAMCVECLYIVNAILHLLVLYLSDDRGLPLSSCASYTSLIMGCSVGGKVLFGCALDSRRCGARAGQAGCVLLLCGATLALQPERTPAGGWTMAPVSAPAQLAAFSVVYGLGYGATFALVQSRAAKAYGGRDGFGRLQGAIVLAQYVGSFGGITLTAALREATGSYLAPFAIFPALAVAMCGHCCCLDGGARARGRRAVVGTRTVGEASWDRTERASDF